MHPLCILIHETENTGTSTEDSSEEEAEDEEEDEDSGERCFEQLYAFKGVVSHFVTFAYSPSCWGPRGKTASALISVS